jgi:hypothetical protein
MKLWAAGESTSTVESNEVTFTVDEPQGQNALVWRRMQELTGGKGWNNLDWMTFGPSLVEEISTIAPSSDYVPYVVSFKWQETAEERRETIETAISLRPQGPVADHLQGVLAGWYYARGEEALYAGDLERALGRFSEARTCAKELSRTTSHFWIRERVERWLAESRWLTEGVVRERYDALKKARAANTGPVIPVVECVDPGSRPNDPYIVWFGYENSNGRFGEKFVERGKGNDLTPSFTKDLPPRVFKPGRQKHAFSVTTHADRITWTIDGQSATASRKTQPRCTYYPDPKTLASLVKPDLKTLALRPVIDCIEVHDDNVIVSFGYENPNAVAIRIAGGPDNRLDGSNESLPTIFEPGRHYDAFRAKAKRGQTVSWTLAGKTASSASRSSSAPCFDERD